MIRALELSIYQTTVIHIPNYSVFEFWKDCLLHKLQIMLGGGGGEGGVEIS